MKRILVLTVAMAIALASGGLFAGGQSESPSKASGPVTIQVAYPVAVDAPITRG